MSEYQAIVNIVSFNVGVRCNSDEITLLDYLPPGEEQAPRTPLAKETVRQLRAYVNDAAFVFALPLAATGTHFQRKVWREIVTIPPGHTTSYGELAKAIKSAPRAVGGACGANPYPLIVPCHRIIAADGGLGGFAKQRGGFLLDIKSWLLEHEQSVAY